MGRPALPGVQLIGIRLRKKDIMQAKKLAAIAAQPYQSVIRAWVAEKADASREPREPPLRSDWR